MPTPEDALHGKTTYERTDVSVPGVVVFMVSLAIFLAVFMVFCFGMGKVINTGIVNHDGPLNKWNALPGKSPQRYQTKNSDAVAEQEELRRLTSQFPEPRVQTDNGDQDTADLHAREDLLLDHYSWVDRKQGKVRIPISRAMVLIARRGLAVEPAAPTEPLMAGDKPIQVAAPLTNGFARTGFEQHEMQTLEQERLRGEAPPEQAALSLAPLKPNALKPDR